jgi:hypothetical protein
MLKLEREPNHLTLSAFRSYTCHPNRIPLSRKRGDEVLARHQEHMKMFSRVVYYVTVGLSSESVS